MGPKSFFQQSGGLIGRPVQPSDELLEYAPTQVLAEFLRDTHGLDGLIFPSAQWSSDRRADPTTSDANVVLFHHAARVDGGKDVADITGVDGRQPTLRVDDSPAHPTGHPVRLLRVTAVRVDYRREWLEGPTDEVEP